ncbi:hypothetical protein J6590_085654, partial [Homalodisca vitripennis]
MMHYNFMQKIDVKANKGNYSGAPMVGQLSNGRDLSGTYRNWAVLHRQSRFYWPWIQLKIHDNVVSSEGHHIIIHINIPIITSPT